VREEGVFGGGEAMRGQRREKKKKKRRSFEEVEVTTASLSLFPIHSPCLAMTRAL
jgi:hypothetical protein